MLNEFLLALKTYIKNISYSLLGGESWSILARSEGFSCLFFLLKKFRVDFTLKLDCAYFFSFTFNFAATQNVFFLSCSSGHVIPLLETLQGSKNTCEAP